MVDVDRRAPVEFLHAAFDADDWIGVLLKTYKTGRVMQRIIPVATATSHRFQAWLRHMNAHGWNVYVSVNAYRPGRSRGREAVAAVRHLFLEEDHDGPGLLAALSTRPDVPPPSYVLHSSPGRVHVLWRVRGLTPRQSEDLQRHLSRELATDRAATSSAQTTRLPGFFNHKRRPPTRIGLELLHAEEVFSPADLPAIEADERPNPLPPMSAPPTSLNVGDRVERARAFLRRVDPAITGQQGDRRTFRVCCRVVRGFALSDDEALVALADWNARCEPPWTERDLRQKVTNARRYGREPEGSLL